MSDKTYIAIDLKSFYASVECQLRGLDPLTTNLVVADESRTEKTICLAVSPSLKSYGIGGRARLFEVVQKVREVNAARRMYAPDKKFTEKSVIASELKASPELELSFIAAPPRMALYMEYSTRIYNIYLKYISPDDIHVYSIDEVFIDATDYIKMYKLSARELAMKMIQDVLSSTGITATAGIGENLYLCKIAMDIVAKHIPADKDGVRIAELTEMEYRRKLWSHTPMTDFWRVGKGVVTRLDPYGIRTMGQLARFSIEHEETLYKLFGVNAELLIDHAWGWEPCTIADIKAYRPETNSISSGQVLSEAYTFAKAKVVAREMAENTALDLVSKRLVTNQIVLTINYDEASMESGRLNGYDGDIVRNYYGKSVPKPSHGTANLGKHTSSGNKITDAAMTLFDKIVNPAFLVRRLNICVNNVISEAEAQKAVSQPVQLELFPDSDTTMADKEADEKERRMQETILDIKRRYGKNAILKGTNFAEGATARERNRQIGGHKA